MRAGKHASPVAIGVVLAVGLATGACGLVVGAGDYVVGPAGDGGPGVSADVSVSVDSPMSIEPVDSAVPPPGPDATPQPDTGVPPMMEAGSPPLDAGTTLVCAPNGDLIPGSLPTGDATFQQLVNACVLAVTCDPLFFPVTISQCITTDYLDTHFPNKCLANIKSCDDYYACQGTRIATLAECQTASNTDTDLGACNGAVATTCFSSGDGIVQNCTALGGTCSTYHESDYADTEDTGAGCEIGPCTNPTDGSNHCLSNTQAFTCVETDTTTSVGILTESCPTGSACSTNTVMSACFGAGTACTTVGTSCNGGDLTSCETFSSGNQQFTSTCAVAGLQCTPAAGVNPAACAAPGCANSGCVESCDGTNITTCIGGAPYVVDCTALGFPSARAAARTTRTTTSAPINRDAEVLSGDRALGPPRTAPRGAVSPCDGRQRAYGPTFMTVPLFTRVATQSVSFTVAASPLPAVRVSKLEPPSVV